MQARALPQKKEVSKMDWMDWKGLPLTIGMWIVFFIVVLPVFGGWSWDLLLWGALGIVAYLLIRRARGW